jgi:hypothetical protein
MAKQYLSEKEFVEAITTRLATQASGGELSSALISEVNKYIPAKTALRCSRGEIIIFRYFKTAQNRTIPLKNRSPV